MIRPARIVPALALLLAACSGEVEGPPSVTDTITEADLARHIERLASDEFGGRGPASPGEALTVAYLEQQFTEMGLEPGNGDSYQQDVPLVSITADPGTQLFFTRDDLQIFLDYNTDMMVWTTRVVESVSVNDSEVVFVGYGINAPEYGWNDYAGVDVTGKTVIILVNDPGFATQNPRLFNGNAMTYYGRWTYKYEEAARQGAAAAIILHETDAAGYPWEVVTGSWSGAQFGLRPENGNMHRVAIEGWITGAIAEHVFEQGGVTLADMKAAAVEPGFQAVEFGTLASVGVTNVLDNIDSKNVIAKLEGSRTPDEYLIYMAHWDHLGIGQDVDGDNIYNGALDNASGTAALLELAEAYASLPQAPDRSVLFIAVTAEEQGLLGSAHYAANPVVPLAQTVAGLNMDGLNIIGPTHDITVSGYGFSELDGRLVTEAVALGRRIVPDPEPEKGYYFRSDHFELAKRGVPMIYPGAGIDHVENGAEWGQAQTDAYVAERYHKPSDEFDPAWDLEGAVSDLRIYFNFGFRLANDDFWPNWVESSEFRLTRDRQLAESRVASSGMISVEESVEVQATANEVWAVIGGFNALPVWHPAIEDSILSALDGVTHRRLVIAGGGGEVFEQLVAADDVGRNYTYRIVESPLPVADYYSLLMVQDSGANRSTIKWSGRFDAVGASAEEAEAVIRGIYQVGLVALAERFKPDAFDIPLAGGGGLMVLESLDVPADPDLVWSLIGSFDDLDAWHPVVVGSDTIVEDGERLRTLDIGGGAHVVERLTESGNWPQSYSYTIVESPLPVTDYHAVIAVQPSANGGTTIIWRGRFNPLEVDPEVARTAIRDIYTVGLDALGRRFTAD